MVTLLTPTGGRPEAFALLERWIERQTYRGELQWIVIDDCIPQTRLTLGQDHLYPVPIWQPGQNTQARNLKAALPFIKGEFVLFIEDDDYYAPPYIAEMVRRLAQAQFVGECGTVFYNVRYRSWYANPNRSSASLFQMGFRVQPNTAEQVANVLGTRGYIDAELCARCRRQLRMFPRHIPALSIGIKGLPGREGIGSGHYPHDLFKPDPQLSILRKWIGVDAEQYAAFHKPKRR